MRPERASSRARSQRGSVATMKASPILTPARSRAAIKSRHSALVSEMGFSQSTCLPASAARMDHGTCRWLGSGL